MSQPLYSDFVQDDFYNLKPCNGPVLVREIARAKQQHIPHPQNNVDCITWKPAAACKLPKTHDFQRKVCEDAVTGTTFSESKFVSCYDTGDGHPKIYEATKRVASAQNGLKQVVRTEKDQGTHTEKMSVGRHINDKGHVEERQRNTKTGQENRQNKYINMSEVDKHHFPKEWRSKTTGLSLEFALDPFERLNFSGAVDYYD